MNNETEKIDTRLDTYLLAFSHQFKAWDYIGANQYQTIMVAKSDVDFLKGQETFLKSKIEDDNVELQVRGYFITFKHI